MKSIIWMLILGLVVLTAWSVFFAVHETQYAVVTRFGDPYRTIKEPGLRVKWPWPIDNVVYFDKRLLVSDTPRPDEPPREFLTKDKKNIEVASYTCWKITDPKVFLERIGTRREDAEARLGEIVISELGKVLGCYELTDLLSTEPGKMKLPQIMGEIRETCRELVKDKDKYDYGVEIIDFQIKRVNFPKQNRTSVFERMRAERKRMATQYRSDGDKEATIIRAEANKESTTILADAYRQAQETEGKADAEATRIYADAYGQDAEFYEFLRTLESYEKSLTQGTTVFLPSDSPYLKWLRSDASVASHGPQSVPPGQNPTSPTQVEPVWRDGEQETPAESTHDRSEAEADDDPSR
ncbi:MAG: protease modulator HflC [Phycisphaerae bacterium]|nr:protease modulator HflC [Phycisphaerae bacterium]